ncbi:universal stress protein [Rhodopseudomonas sp. WA056]|uniref:universal stress protein n=1 Tax=Rhodopseudomonas sp. WA056 TaxID=2269367 RepID=UPI0013DF9880|nr:universal stress protein [Rhodopseudomonas sp. WA056]NEW87543.1 universal stress protein [Rhodopseudomonas sp. WA056]
MAFKTIVVFVDQTPASDARVRYAAGLAMRHQAHLIGLFIVPNAWQHDSADSNIQGGAAIRDMLERHNLIESNALQAAGRSFEAMAARDDASFEYRAIRGSDVGELVRLHCLHADLVVVGHPSAGLPAGWSPEQMLLSTGVPVLIIPAGWPEGTTARNVLFAWNASREARRAITDSLPMLCAAEKVSVVVVDPTNNPLHGQEPGADVAHYLSRHGVAARVERLRSNGESVAEVIRRYAADDQSDLIVLGAYSHSPKRELLFGGVTRTLLSKVSIPTLISH